jgi:hypothetical protein
MTHGYGELRWNDIGRRKSKNSERNLSQCHFAHQKPDMNITGPQRREVGD